MGHNMLWCFTVCGIWEKHMTYCSARSAALWTKSDKVSAPGTPSPEGISWNTHITKILRIFKTLIILVLTLYAIVKLTKCKTKKTHTNINIIPPIKIYELNTHSLLDVAFGLLQFQPDVTDEVTDFWNFRSVLLILVSDPIHCCHQSFHVSVLS